MKAFLIALTDDPLIATAIHDGHRIRPAIRSRIALTDSQRLREEDPFTGQWAKRAASHIIGLRSRFEFDLNRSREKAVYQLPADAWELNVWQQALDRRTLANSLKCYDAFYEQVHQSISRLLTVHARIVVLDLHSYCHRRDGIESEPACVDKNPDVDIGTGGMDRQFWAPVVERLKADLNAYDYRGRQLDVRENIKFKGGHFGRWLQQTFPQRVCAPAIEFKKFFMDEWTGKPDQEAIELIGNAIESTFPGLRVVLDSEFGSQM